MAEARSFVEKIQQTDLTGGRDRVHMGDQIEEERGDFRASGKMDGCPAMKMGDRPGQALEEKEPIKSHLVEQL